MIKKICAPPLSMSFQQKSYFGSFSEGDVKQAEKYVLETLRSRSWAEYLIANHIPKALRPSYCALRLFDLELIRISDNIREPSLGFIFIYCRAG